jgi:hypothetical protein
MNPSFAGGGDDIAKLLLQFLRDDGIKSGTAQNPL